MVDLNSLKVKELRQLATDKGIDLGELTKKAEIVNYLNEKLDDVKKKEEESNMTEQNVNVNEEAFKNEGVNGDTPVDTKNDTPKDETPAKEEKKTEKWILADGTEGSKSAFIREKFLEDNMTRKEIEKTYDIPYRTVYGATINMENERETTRDKGNQKLMVEPESNAPVVKHEDVMYVGGVEIEEADYALIEKTLVEVNRDEWIKEQVEAGAKRADLAKQLFVSYGVVYAATKDQGGTRVKHEVEYNGKIISRSEYIRILFKGGMKKADIAKELGVDYSVVWSATKEEKSNKEKYEDALDKVAKLADLVSEASKESYLQALATLAAVAIDEPKEETEEKEETAETPNVEANENPETTSDEAAASEEV